MTGKKAMLMRVFLWVVAISAGVSGLLVASLPRAPGPPPAPVPPSLQELIAESSELSASDLDAHCHIDSVALKRDVCFGSCPIYSVIFFKTGHAEYVGEAFVDHVGSFEGSISPRDFARLCQLVESDSFEKFKSEYAGTWTDSPFAFITVVKQGKAKKISDYDESGPAELWALERSIDSVANQVDWKSKKSSVDDPAR